MPDEHKIRAKKTMAFTIILSQQSIDIQALTKKNHPFSSYHMATNTPPICTNMNVTWYNTSMKKRRYWHISAYSFTPITNLRRWRDRLTMFLNFFDVKGTILLSKEGINIALTLCPMGLTAFERLLKSHGPFRQIVLKKTTTDRHAFSRMSIKIKSHIVPFVSHTTGHTNFITANELDAHYNDYIMLDVRNDYEVNVGTFKNAHHFDVKNFMDFAKKLEEAPQAWKDKKMVIFCTGGIRCEKVSPLMEKMGFKHTYQLDGGIIEYLRTTTTSHWEGECFTFDRRVSLTQKLAPGSYTMCFACRAPLAPNDLTHPHYQPEVSCHYCAPKRLHQSKNPEATHTSG